jgi:hypothetical protein
MNARRMRLVARATLLCLTLTACATLLAPGSRQWVIPVENQSNVPARLFVAQDESPMGDLVGTAEPNVVAPGATTDVVFTVPAGRSWAVFVNPGPMLGPLIGAGDVPADAAGELPLRIVIDENGSPGAQLMTDEPGWFGN